MSYTQFGYSPYQPASQLMVGSAGQAGSTAGTCCDPARPSVTVDSGQSATAAAAVCTLPPTYDSRLLSSYPRLATGFYNSAPYGSDQAGYANLAGVESTAFYSSLNSAAYGMKDATDPWRITQQASYYYDPTLAAYGYGGLDFNGTRRKNVTRDSTSTLKAWLNEHRKNPYPTKGEKIMLAIITKMTLTQVSTWFANARRRLKKENKMTWEPRNKIDADHDTSDAKVSGDGTKDDDRQDGDDQSEDDVVHRGASVGDSEAAGNGDGDTSDTDDGDSQLHLDIASEDENRDLFTSPGRTGGDTFPAVSDSLSGGRCVDAPAQQSPLIPRVADFTPSDSESPLPDINSIIRSPSVTLETKGSGAGTECAEHLISSSKPKIWSLADTATSKSPPPTSALSVPFGDVGSVAGDNNGRNIGNHCGWFSSTPYHVNNSSTSISHLVGNVNYSPFASPQGNGMFPNAAGSASYPGVHGLSPVPPQTDTPPQTPPNMKVSTALPLPVTAGYLSSQSSHLYLGQTASSSVCGSGHLQATHVGKSSGLYAMNHVTRLARSTPTYRSECLADDFTSHTHYRAPQIQ